MQDELFDSNRIDVARVAAQVRTGTKGATPEQLDYDIAQNIIRGIGMRGEELTATDYMTRPMLELMSHPNYDHDAYLIVAELSGMTNADIRKLNVEVVNNA